MTDRELLEKARKVERHGMRWTPEYQSWLGMKQRCTNPKKREYPHYGGRGIKVCEEWMNSFSAFYAHIGAKPSNKHSLDRINVNGDYAPNNVRWATHQEQVDNTTVVRMVSIGERTQSISAWEREMGLSKGQVRAREASGWDLTEAILTPSVKAQKIHKYVPQGYSKLKNGTYRVLIDGKYIKTVQTENEAKALVATRRAIVKAAAAIGESL